MALRTVVNRIKTGACKN